MRLVTTAVLSAALAMVGLGCDNGGPADPAPMDPTQPASGQHTEPAIPQSSDAMQTPPPSPGDPATGDRVTPEQPASEQPAPGNRGLSIDP